MTPALREQFRLKLLQLVDTAGAVGMRAAAIDTHLAAHGYEHSEYEMKAEIAYLTDKGLVAQVDKVLSPENKRWRVTAAGRDFLAEQGLG
jgi:hypothetical protein